MEVITRIRLKADIPFMGKGVRELLLAIEELESLRQASAKTGISYPKALRMIKDLNESVGFEVVVSSKGGSTRGGSFISEEGKKFLDTFIEIENEVQLYAEKLVKDRFNK